MIVKLLCVVEVDVPAGPRCQDIALAQARSRLDAFRGAPSVYENMEERGITLYQATPDDLAGMHDDKGVLLDSRHDLSIVNFYKTEE